MQSCLKSFKDGNYFSDACFDENRLKKIMIMIYPLLLFSTIKITLSATAVGLFFFFL